MATAGVTVLVTLRSSVRFSGVVSLAWAVAGWALFAPSSAMLAVLLMRVTPAGTGLTTVTAKTALPLAPPLSDPLVKVQTVLAGLPLAQLQPTVLAAALNVVLAGTVSLRTTPVAAWLPVLVKLKV